MIIEVNEKEGFWDKEKKKEEGKPFLKQKWKTYIWRREIIMYGKFFLKMRRKGILTNIFKRSRKTRFERKNQKLISKEGSNYVWKSSF